MRPHAKVLAALPVHNPAPSSKVLSVCSNQPRAKQNVKFLLFISREWPCICTLHYLYNDKVCKAETLLPVLMATSGRSASSILIAKNELCADGSTTPVCKSMFCASSPRDLNSLISYGSPYMQKMKTFTSKERSNHSRHSPAILPQATTTARPLLGSISPSSETKKVS